MNISPLLLVTIFLGVCSIVQSGTEGKARSRRYRQKSLSSLGRVKELGMKKVAQGSAQRAHRAIVMQQLAGQKAAFVAKSVLAESAIEAAEAAEIAVETKAAILESMEKRRSETYSDLVLGIAKMNLAKHTATASMQTADNAAHAHQFLAEVLKHEQEFARHAAANAEHAGVMLKAQETMFNQAKANLENIEKQIQYAHEEHVTTSKIAKEASAAARAAFDKVSHVADDVYDRSERVQARRKDNRGKKRKASKSFKVTEGEIVRIIGKHGG